MAPLSQRLVCRMASLSQWLVCRMIKLQCWVFQIKLDSLILAIPSNVITTTSMNASYNIIFSRPGLGLLFHGTSTRVILFLKENHSRGGHLRISCSTTMLTESSGGGRERLPPRATQKHHSPIIRFSETKNNYSSQRQAPHSHKVPRCTTELSRYQEPRLSQWLAQRSTTELSRYPYTDSFTSQIKVAHITYSPNQSQNTFQKSRLKRCPSILLTKASARCLSTASVLSCLCFGST